MKEKKRNEGSRSIRSRRGREEGKVRRGEEAENARSDPFTSSFF